MTLTIDVTAEDIAAGKRSSGCDCPIALAAKRKLGRRDGVGVGSLAINIGGDWSWLPQSARVFIRRFDDCRPVEPFSFEINP